MMDETNPAVQKHLEILLSIIDRMASNSSNCKTWCITVVSAILALAYQQDNIAILNISYIPLLLFFLLDSYYLSIERDLRDDFKVFVTALHNSSLDREQIYNIQTGGKFFYQLAQTLKVAFSSASTLPFYALVLGLLIVSGLIA